MSSQPPTPPEAMLQRVNLFGAITERLFSRLYSGVQARSKSTDDANRAQLEALKREKAQMIVERNKQLRQALHRREAEAARLNGILATLDEGVIMQDNEGRIVLINAAAHKLLGTQKNFWESELGTL
ncbi:MAG: PAS domain-containing protein, partial [Armatimonadetes bacterium]|nr:PAS domain-containing protein [Anaerolineae bacterium]